MDKRGKYRFIYVISGLALFFLLLPEAIRLGAQYGLKKLAAESATIEDIDLNLFTGRAAVTGLKVTYNNKETINLGYLLVDIDMAALFSQHLLFDEVMLSNIQLTVYEENGQWVVGIPIPTSEAAQPAEESQSESSWGVGLNQMDLDQVQLKATYQGKTHQVKFDRLTAEKLYMWQPDNNANLIINGQLNGAELDFSGELKPFAESRTFQLGVQLNQFDLSPIKQFLPESIKALAAKIDLDTELSVALKPNGDIALNQNGKARLMLEEFAGMDVTAVAEEFLWQGSIGVDILTEQQPKIEAKGTITASEVVAGYQPLGVTNQLNKLIWQGTVNLDLANINQATKVNGDLTLEGLLVYDEQAQTELLGYQSLELQQVKLNGVNALTIQQLVLEQLTALNQSPNKEPASDVQKPLLALNHTNVSEIALQDLNHLNINEVNLQGIQGDVVRSKDGVIEILSPWLESFMTRLDDLPKSDESQQKEETEASESPFKFQVAAIQVSGDNNITFTDKGVQPVVVHPIQIESVEIGKIDSTAVEALTPLSASLKLYDHGYLKLKGKASPLQSLAAMNAQLDARIKGVELPELSPYIEQAMGYRVNSGQLNLTSKAAIQQGQLDSETRVKVLRVDFDPVNQEVIAKVSKKLTMPVDTALSIITDSNDTLKLDVPIKGDLAKPDVHLNKIIQGAVLQAVQNSAFTYFKYAVQPFGAIMLVSETIGDMRLQAKFKDVIFVPGKAQVVAEQEGYLEKVANMIKEKKDFSILVCPVITDQDFAARENPPKLAEGEKHQWDKASRALAKARINLIKTVLMEEYGLEADSVQTCQPQLGEGQPRAIMGI